MVATLSPRRQRPAPWRRPRSPVSCACAALGVWFLLPASAHGATTITATGAEVQGFLAGGSGKLVYTDSNEQGKCYWIDLGDMSVHELSADTDVSEPLISPDGTRVVYGIYNIISKWPGESQDNEGDAYVRAFAGGSRVHVAGAAVAGRQAFAPHWWVDPATGAEHIVYMDYYEKDTQSVGGRATWKQPLIDGQPTGDPVKILDHAFDGGLSRDGTRVGEAYHYLHMALTMDLGGGDGDSITPRLDGGNQCCNSSMSPDDAYHIMHLRIDHEGCNIRDWDDNLVATIWKPDGATEMQNPEFSTHPGYSTFSAQYGADYYIYIANTETGAHLKIAEGNFSNPHLWVAPDTPSLSLSPASLSFQAVEGAPAPTSQIVAVGNAGAGTLDGVSASEDAPWLTVTISGSGNAQQLENAVDPAGLAADTYTVAVAVGCANADNSPRTYDVRLVVSPPAPDTEPPSVAITLPGDGAAVAGVIGVEGVASDDRAVSLVEIQVDDGAFAPASGTESWSTTVDTAALADGAHTLTARAADAAGNTATDTVSVLVDNTAVQPRITLLAPVGGEIWEVGTTQHIRWETDGIEDVTLRYSGDGGVTFEVIEVTIDVGHADWADYPWVVPDTPTERALVFVMGYFGEAPTQSGLFAIRRPGEDAGVVAEDSGAVSTPPVPLKIGAADGCACRAPGCAPGILGALALGLVLRRQRRR